MFSKIYRNHQKEIELNSFKPCRWGKIENLLSTGMWKIWIIWIELKTINLIKRLLGRYVKENETGSRNDKSGIIFILDENDLPKITITPTTIIA